MVKLVAPHPVVASLLLAPLGTALAQEPSVEEVRQQLADLATALEFQGTMADTYRPVLEKANLAFDTVAKATNESDFWPQVPTTLEALTRIKTEAKYFVDESTPVDYVTHPLEVDEYLIANVDEWSHAVDVLGERLLDPFCDVVDGAPAPVKSDITADAAPGTVFKDNDLTPTLVVIPTGSYQAGSSDEEQANWRVPLEKQNFEKPQRTVTISKKLAFSRTEVSVGEFRKFIEATCYQPRGGARWWEPSNVDNFGFEVTLSWDSPGFPQNETQPVVAVTRQDIKAYTKWLSAVSGATYRLPNEDEWEWAARGGTQDIFFWGSTLLPDGSKYANTYDDAASDANHFRWPSNGLVDGFPHTAPVGSFLPNGYGLYDMTANAREFMADDWIENLGEAAHDGSIHAGPVPFPVFRGGAWNYNPRNLRINYRSAYFSSEISTNMFGIRLVRDLE
jgi:formylglycine-generating enzyme required for sulfatase activity